MAELSHPAATTDDREQHRGHRVRAEASTLGDLLHRAGAFWRKFCHGRALSFIWRGSTMPSLAGSPAFARGRKRLTLTPKAAVEFFPAFCSRAKRCRLLFLIVFRG